MNKFKVGDTVRVVKGDAAYNLLHGFVYTVSSVHPIGNISLADTGTVLWSPDRFELVQEDSVLTPEEVFEHLRKGTKLQIFGLYNTRTGSIEKWLDAPPVELITYNTIVAQRWRIKPEPEVIELNGKKYREIME